MSGLPIPNTNLTGASLDAPASTPSRFEASLTSIPPRIPDHELLRRIGRGSYGDVWLARNVMGTYRAVKIVYRIRFENDRPFDREFEGIQKFEPISRSHEGQVNILHVGRGAGYFYYVMELADDASAQRVAAPVKARSGAFTGEDETARVERESDRAFTGAATYRPHTLKAELQKRARLPFDQCLRIALSLTNALAHLHKHGLVHRDIKPSNIIFVHGLPKLADIGLVTDLDATMSFVGTEGFLPPEGRGSLQGDIYGLGKVLYEMSTGKDRLDFPEPRTDLAALPERALLVEFNEVVLRACAPDPRQRYQTTEEMHSDLVLLQSGKSLRRARWLEQRLTLLTRVGVGAALVALLAIAFSYQSKRAERRAEEQVHRIHVAQGARLLNEGDLYGSVLWFAKALNLGYSDPIQEEVNRFRIGTALSFSPRLSQVFFHREMIHRAVFSPNGDWIATASADHTARVWDAATGEPVTPPLQHQNEVRDVEFSPDGRWLITASNDCTARVWDAATGKPISSPLKHSNTVYRATFHPGGLLVATASEDRTAKIWDAQTGESVGPPLQHEDRVGCVRFSPNGDWVATASRDGTARIWKMPTGEHSALNPPLHPSQEGNQPRVYGTSFPSWEGQGVGSSNSRTALTNRASVILRHAAEVREIAFSADGRRLATASADRTARAWDARTGISLTPPLKHSDEVWCIAFSPDGRFVATGSKDGAARIWDTTNGEALTPPLQHGSNLRSVAFSPNGRWLATASSDRTARLWNVGNGKPATSPLRHASNVQSTAFDRVGARLITTGRDGTARVWDLTHLDAVELRMMDEAPISRVAISTDGRRVATCPLSVQETDYALKETQLWNLQANPPAVTRISTLARSAFVDFSPDGRCVATAGSDALVQLWEAFTGRKIADLAGHTSEAGCAAFSPDGRFLATGGIEKYTTPETASGAVWFWDPSEAKPLGPPIRLPHRVNYIAFSKDGRRLVVCLNSTSIKDEYGFAQVWDVATRRPIGPLIHHRGAVSQASFSPDGKRLVTAFGNTGLGPCEAQVWNPVSGAPIAPLIKHADGLSAASFSPDGKWVVTASEDTTARVWNSFTSEPRTPALQHGAQVQWAEFSPDGNLVLTASMDGTARVWDASTGQPVTPPLQHDGPVRHAIFSKDGRSVVTASEDRTSRVWKLAKDDRPATELLRLAELLASQKIDATGGLVPLEAAELRDRWKSLRSSRPFVESVSKP